MSQKQHHKDDDNQTENGMVRGLQNRHVQLIAIAGTNRYRSLPRGRAFSLPNRTFNYLSIYTNWYLHVSYDASDR